MFRKRFDMDRIKVRIVIVYIWQRKFATLYA